MQGFGHSFLKDIIKKRLRCSDVWRDWKTRVLADSVFKIGRMDEGDSKIVAERMTQDTARERERERWDARYS